MGIELRAHSLVMNDSVCFNPTMRFYKTFVAVLLVLFSIGTVHAATMGVTMAFATVQDAPAMHCHEMDGHAGDDHAKPHQANACASCVACVPMMSAQSPCHTLPKATAAQNPHSEASYASFIGKLPHRPPISA